MAAVARSVEGWRDDGNPASFRRWVSRVARNVVIKFMTRERKQIGGHGGTDLMELLENVPNAADRESEEAYEHEWILWTAEKVRGEFRETSWKAFWATLTPSAKRDYIEWITEAKQPATRARRLAEAVTWLGAGKRRNWKYER